MLEVVSGGFQSTLLHEERRSGTILKDATRQRFQSTLLHEERLLVVWRYTYGFISIHAPTRGATGFCSSTVRTICYFNPRSYTRSDRLARRYWRRQLRHFNPRSYTRSDSTFCDKCGRYSHFNPRSYTRSDSGSGIFQNSPVYFNPRSYTRSDDRILL